MKQNQKKYTSREKLFADYLHYGKQTGVIYWKKRPRWSHVKIGDPVGCKSQSGYRVFHLDGAMFFAHRVAWWMSYGKWPVEELDHINGDRFDNRMENLREATRLENTYNKRPFSKTGTGLKGAYTHASMNGKWFAQIVANKKQIYLGRFDTEAEAHAAYVVAARKHHGEFGRTS